MRFGIIQVYRHLKKGGELNGMRKVERQIRTHRAGGVADGVMFNTISRGLQAFRYCVNATVSMGFDPLEPHKKCWPFRHS